MRKLYYQSQIVDENSASAARKRSNENLFQFILIPILPAESAVFADLLFESDKFRARTPVLVWHHIV